jgi:hypothetical protein
MKVIGCTLALVAALAIAGGCSNSGKSQNSMQLRALNAVADAEPLDFLLDDDVKYAGLELGKASASTELPSGTHDVKLRSSTFGTTLLDKSTGFADGATYTFLGFGKRAAIQSVLLDEATSDASSGKFKVRAVGLSPDSGVIDLYLASTAVTGVPPSLSSIGYGAPTDYSEISPGSYPITITAGGTKEILFQSAAQSFTQNEKVALAVLPSTGGKLVNLTVLVNGGAATFLPNPLGRLKAVNAMPDSTPVNFKADSAVLLSSVPFAGTSSYVTLAAGTRQLQLEAANVPGSTIASASQAVGPAADYTVLALGGVSTPSLAVIADDNTLPAAGLAKVRFVNAVSGGAAIDALVNFAGQAQGIAPGTASAYSQLAPSTTYTITFATAGGVTVLATLGSSELDAGGVYTALLLGTASAPQARLVRDR